METEEITNFWNKKTSDLTVKELAIVSFATPIIMIGSIVVVGVSLAAKDKIVKLFKKEKVVVEITKTETTPEN